MGLVHVRGRAAGEERLTSPITRTPCYFYKVDIEKWERDQNRSRWRHYTTDLRGLRFYVEDTTGKVLVDPNGAECDLVRRGQRVIGDSGFSLRSLFEKKAAPLADSEPTEDEIRDYLTNLRADLRLPLSVEDPQTRAMAGGAQGVGPLGVVFATRQSWTFGGRGLATGRFRLTEYCIVPDESYNVTGTCVVNPSSHEETDRNLIVKGQNEPTFLISWRDEQDIESRLRNRALVYIFGGGLLAVGCLYLFIWFAQLGWI